MAKQPSEIDVYRAAQAVISYHGENASIYAAMRQDELMNRGDFEGVVVWQRIATAMKVLLSKTTDGLLQ